MRGSSGSVFRKAFVTLFKQFSGTVLIHRDFNSPGHEVEESRALENGPSETSRDTVFQFLAEFDLPIGSVLQVKGSNDYWRVFDTRSEYTADVFLYFEAHVEKVSADGIPTRRPSSGNTNYYLHGDHSRVNIASHDSSSNISYAVTQNVFDDIRHALEQQVENGEQRQVMLNIVNEMEYAKGTASFLEKYTKLIAVAADHLGVITPFLPALSPFFGG